MNTQRMIRALATLAVVVTAAAPAQLQAQQESDTQATVDATPMLRVTNNNWLDMHIYIMRLGGPALSLGVVPTNSTMEYKIPTDIINAADGLRVIADPIGDTGFYVSPEMLVSSGSDVVLDVENALSLSNTSVQPKMVSR